MATLEAWCGEKRGLGAVRDVVGEVEVDFAFDGFAATLLSIE